MERKFLEKININILKEVTYVLLLITFFVGVMIGSFSLKNVSNSNLEEYELDIRENIVNISDAQKLLLSENLFTQGVKIIIVFWVVGMSIVGTPILVGYIGYKGFSLGYTISAIIKILGTIEGNKYVFENLFLKNVILIFIMFYMANYSIKIFKNFLENKKNMRVDAIKYTIISTFMFVLYLLIFAVIKVIT